MTEMLLLSDNIIMNLSKDICSHIKHLSKQAIKKLVSSEMNKTCSIHSNLPLYYLCLHCGSSLCLQFEGLKSCLQIHSQNHNHYFYLEIENGSIWCQLCNDTIQNQLFEHSPDDKSDTILKLRRFQTYISEIWKQISIKNGVKATISSHRGIKNLGNTCYLNVVLQSLFASQSLKQLYERIQVYEDKILINAKVVPKEIEYFYDDMISKRQSERWNIVTNKKDKGKQQSKKIYAKTIKNGSLNVLFKNFFESMSSKDPHPYVPRELLNILSEFNGKYLHKQQQDAEQLLLLIIDLLSEGQRINFLKDSERYKQVENILGFQKLTPIQSIFGFYLVNEIQCNQCKQISMSMNLAYNIPLALEEGQKEDYKFKHQVSRLKIDYWQELFYPQAQDSCSFLAPFFKTERLNKSNNYYECSKCRSILAFRRHFIVSQPEILAVSIKRFTSKLQKKHAYTQFPEELTLNGVSLDKVNDKYRLYAIIVHQGSTIASGHYICFIRIQAQWLLCSDDNIQIVSWKYVKTQHPYVLLYQRVTNK